MDLDSLEGDELIEVVETIQRELRALTVRVRRLESEADLDSDFEMTDVDE